MNSVWKYRAECYSHFLISHLLMKWIFLNAVNSRFYVICKAFFQAFLLFIVPILRIANIKFDIIMID